MGKATIESTHLRAWRASDADALAEAFRTTPDLDSQLGGAQLDTADRAGAFIDERLRDTDTRRSWAIVHDGIPVGNVGLSTIEHRHGTAWAFYWVAATARGQGLATRALIAAGEWAFAEGLFRLELGYRVNNPVPLIRYLPAERVSKPRRTDTCSAGRYRVGGCRS